MFSIHTLCVDREVLYACSVHTHDTCVTWLNYAWGWISSRAFIYILYIYIRENIPIYVNIKSGLEIWGTQVRVRLNIKSRFHILYIYIYIRENIHIYEYQIETREIWESQVRGRLNIKSRAYYVLWTHSMCRQRGSVCIEFIEYVLYNTLCVDREVLCA